MNGILSIEEPLEVPCASGCGPVQLKKNEDGFEGGHYLSVIVAHEDDITDSNGIVDEYVDTSMIDDESHAVIYTECEECCHFCNSDIESSYLST